MVKRFDNLARDLGNLAQRAKAIKTDAEVIVGNITFSFEEQELIRRVFKSVFNQFKSVRDKETARSVMEKTGWIDESG